MLRQFSRISIFIQLIAVIIVALVLFMPAFLNPLPSPAIPDKHSLYSFFSALVGNSPLINAVLAMGIIGFLAFFLYAILLSHDLHPKESLLPVLFYFLLAASITEAVSIGPALLASLFLMISLFLIIRMHGLNQPFKQVFSASFCVSIAAIFYPPAVNFMLFIWLSLLTYRIASWREWIISIIGAIVPLLYLIVYFYWKGRLPDLFNNFNEIYASPMTGFPKFRLWQFIFLCFTGFALLLALFRQLIVIQDRLISLRRKTWIFIDFMIVASLSALLAGHDLPGHIAIIAIPGAFFLSNSVTGKKTTLLYELLSALLIILLVLARLSG